MMGVGVFGGRSVATNKISTFRPIYWLNGKVKLIDQTRLPLEEVWLELVDYREVVSAIKEMRIRGAPAIGVAGAYAVALAALETARERLYARAKASGGGDYERPTNRR